MQRGETLAVAVFATVVMTALFLEDKHFVGFALLEHLGGDEGAGNAWRADHDFVAGEAQHLVQFNGIARGALKFFNFNDAACGHSVLLATGKYDCVHNETLFVSCCSTF